MDTIHDIYIIINNMAKYNGEPKIHVSIIDTDIMIGYLITTARENNVTIEDLIKFIVVNCPIQLSNLARFISGNKSNSDSKLENKTTTDSNHTFLDLNTSLENSKLDSSNNDDHSNSETITDKTDDTVNLEKNQNNDNLNKRKSSSLDKELNDELNPPKRTRSESVPLTITKSNAHNHDDNSELQRKKISLQINDLKNRVNQKNTNFDENFIPLCNDDTYMDKYINDRGKYFSPKNDAYYQYDSKIKYNMNRYYSLENYSKYSPEPKNCENFFNCNISTCFRRHSNNRRHVTCGYFMKTGHCSYKQCPLVHPPRRSISRSSK